MKKLRLLLILSTLVILPGCVPKKNSVATNPKNEKPSQPTTVNIANCIPEGVQIEGYGDKGKRLANCFVQYPGEPSRQDKSYYIVEDICGQFTKEFVQNALGKPIIKIEPSTTAGLYNCSYFFDENYSVMLVLNYLKFENQKTGQEALGRTTKEEPQIPMKNMIVYQEDGVINSLYLVLSEDKFISIQRSSKTSMTNQELIDFAANLAKEIKDYK